MFLLIYVTSTPAIFFNFQVKRDGRESNRATNLSPPPRLKMTDIKQKQPTTEKSKVYIILSPFPTPTPPPLPPSQRKKYSLLGKGRKRDFFSRLEKIIQPPHPKENNNPPLKKAVQSSPVQSAVLTIRLLQHPPPLAIDLKACQHIQTTGS